MKDILSIPLNYNISLAFVVFVSVLLTIYMAYRCIRRLTLFPALTFFAQLLVLTTGVLTVKNQVLTLPVYEVVLIFLGVLLPSGYLLLDYARMKKRIKSSSRDVPLVERLEKPDNRLWRFEDYMENPDEWKGEIQPEGIIETLAIGDKAIRQNLIRQIQAAQGLIENEAYNEALDRYVFFDNILSDNAFIAYNTAWLHRKIGAFEEAMPFYKKALALLGEDKGSDAGANEKGKGKKAASGEKESLKLVKANVHFGWGLCYYSAQKYELAINQFTLARQWAGELREADINIARAYMGLGVLEEAEAHIKTALESKEDVKLRFLLARICAERKLHMECRYHLEKIVQEDGDFTEAWAMLGKLYRQDNDWKNAVHAYKKLAGLAPRDADVYYRLATAQRQEGHMEEALANFRFAVELKPDHSRALYSLASVFDGEGKTDKAVDYLIKSLGGDEKLEMAYNLLSEIYISTDRMQNAINTYEEACEQHPDSYLLRYNLGISLMMVKRYDEAVRVFKRAQKLTSDDSSLYYNWASAAIGLKNFSEAARLYKEGLRFKADDDEILFGLARVSALQGDLEATVAFLSKAFDVNPELRIRAKASHDFASIRTTPEFMEITRLPAKEERMHA